MSKSNSSDSTAKHHRCPVLCAGASNAAMERERERLAPLFRQFELIERVSGIAKQLAAEAEARAAKQEARREAKRLYVT